MIKGILVCLLAGLGAGITTGFAGLSAAVCITPMLTVFTDISFYDAVGIALASDVLASAASARTYSKSGNIDLRQGAPLMLSVWITSFAGSISAYFLSSGDLGNTVMGYFSMVCSLIMGIDLLLRADKSKKDLTLHDSHRHLAAVLCGIYIGFVCGFQGTGGGVMLLLTLTLVMSFSFKTAVGTSVFIMAVTALMGAISHFAINGLPNTLLLAVSVASTTLFARLGAVIATRLPTVRLKRITGVILTVLSAGLLVVKSLGTSFFS